MTLPASGPISASMINAELGRDSNARFHLNGAAERTLAGVSSGLVTFADFYGKSKGSPTPDGDYPDPNTITKSQAASGTTTRTASLTFDTDGLITVVGTPTTALPTRWYQNGTPPTGYKLLTNFVSATITGNVDPGGSIEPAEINYPTAPFWQALAAGNNFGAWVQISPSTGGLPTAVVRAIVVYDIYLSNGSDVIVTFRLTVDLTVTA